MKRNIVLSKEKLENSINISDLPKIINHSVDLLMCDLLEDIPPKDLEVLVKQILEKIRPTGYCVFKILDVKKICSNFLTNKISNTDFVTFFNEKQNIVTLDMIYSIFNVQEFVVAKLEQQENYISIVLQRTGL